MKYKTKPFIIDAFQYRVDRLDELLTTFPEADFEITFESQLKVWDFLQKTWVLVNDGDYVIKGMKGEFYPCDPDVFEAKYEQFDE